MATEATLPATGYQFGDRVSLPSIQSPSALAGSSLDSAKATPKSPVTGSHVLTTIYCWPTMEPLRFEQYPANHLHLPFRRDILHRAVIYEGDKTRQGTASTKWRKDVYGSGGKIQPQKGMGRARAGDKKSPIRKGGGVAFGPHPRDFTTGLQRKIYDLAWRTALSYRYRRGQLLVIDNKVSIDRYVNGPRLLTNIFEGNEWSNQFGRSTLVTSVRRERLYRSMDEIRREGIVKDMFDVDVKDLLTTGRIVIEKQALDTILMAHQSDIGPRHSMQHAAKVVAGRRKEYTIEESDEDLIDESTEVGPDGEEVDSFEDDMDPDGQPREFRHDRSAE
jgi:large subunit ribosomal protein L4